MAKVIKMNELKKICFFNLGFNFLEKEKEANIKPSKTKNWPR